VPIYLRGFRTGVHDTIYAENIDNPGGTLYLRREGGEAVTLSSSTIHTYGDIRLGTDKELQDSSGTALIAGDNSGNIDQLARVDTSIRSPDDANEIVLAGSQMIGDGSVAPFHARLFTVDDSVASFIVNLNEFFGGKVTINDVTIYYNTAADNDYIAVTTVSATAADGSGAITILQDYGSWGSGWTGDDNYTELVDYEMESGYFLRVYLRATINSAAVDIYGCKITYTRG
jgi:hypothetical protein